MTSVEYDGIRITMTEFGYIRCENDGATIRPATLEADAIAAAIDAHIEHWHR